MTSQPKQLTQPSGLSRGARGAEPPVGRHAAASSARGAWLLVATREIITRLTNRTFVVSTLVTLGFITALAAWSVSEGNATETYRVAVSDEESGAVVLAARDAVAKADDSVVITALTVSGDAPAKAAINDGSADGWLHRSGDSFTFTTTTEPDRDLFQAITDSVRDRVLAENATAAGTTVETLTSGATLATERLDGGSAESEGLRKLASFAFALLFFMAAMMFGQAIATSVVEEKQSRLVEIIATAIPLRELLVGKIVGNSVIALGQVLVFAAVGLVAMSFTDMSTMVASLSGAVAWFVVFFIIGFVTLACLFAVGGALASRTEDIQATTAPVTIILMGVYVLGFGASGTALTVASYLPIASVVAMPGRVLAGTAAWWEPLASLGVLTLCAAATLAVGEKVYRRSLLHTGGGRLSWRQALAVEE